jgi:predicted AAA+ superfamily ATPase
MKIIGYFLLLYPKYSQTMKKRKYFDQIVQHLNNNEKEFLILSGARQTGKTVLLKQCVDFLAEKGETPFYFTLEDPAIKNSLNGHPENLFRFIPKSKDKRIFVLIDEIQYLDDPSNFLKYHFDLYAPGLLIVATGSSAFYIDEKFKDSLAGRKKLIQVFTMGFNEFLDFRADDNSLLQEFKMIRENTDYISLRRKEIMGYLDEYLIYGGYPAVVTTADIEKKKEIIRELISSYLKRDILESGIKSEETLFNLLKILAGTQNSQVNKHELSVTLRVSTTAIENYFTVLQKCFHLALVKPFYTNIRKEITKMPVVYFHDLGFRNVLNNLFSPVDERLDKGKLIENFIFIRLREKYPYGEINYWRTTDGNEVDFVVNSGDEKFAIESKFNQNQFRPGKYGKFKEGYPDFPLTCRTYLADNNATHILGL